MIYKNICLSCGERFKEAHIYWIKPMVQDRERGLIHINIRKVECPNCRSEDIRRNTDDRFFQCIDCGHVGDYEDFEDEDNNTECCPECKSSNFEEI